MTDGNQNAAGAQGNQNAGAAAAAGAGAANTGAAAGAAAQDWTSGFDEDARGYVQNKGFKDPATLLKSYRNFESLMGVPQDRVLKLPEKADAPEWNDIYNRLGRPEKADDYKLPLPEGASEDFAKWAKGTFHGLGLTRAQGEKLAAQWNEFSKGAMTAKQSQEALSAEKSSNELKKEWGAEFDQRVKVAKQAAQKFGVADEVIDAIEKSAGFAGVMKLMHAVGASVGEDKFVGGDGGQNNQSSPEMAKQRIKALMTDTDFYSRLNAGGAVEKEEWSRLHKIAYPQN